MPYAIFVHEKLQAQHDGARLYSSVRKVWYTGDGQAKFLEKPLREGRQQMRQILNSAMKSGQSVGSAMALSGIWLMNESKKLCPVDTGALRDSAFVEVEGQ